MQRMAKQGGSTISMALLAMMESAMETSFIVLEKVSKPFLRALQWKLQTDVWLLRMAIFVLFFPLFVIQAALNERKSRQRLNVLEGEIARMRQATNAIASVAATESEERGRLTTKLDIALKQRKTFYDKYSRVAAQLSKVKVTKDQLEKELQVLREEKQIVDYELSRAHVLVEEYEQQMKLFADRLEQHPGETVERALPEIAMASHLQPDEEVTGEDGGLAVAIARGRQLPREDSGDVQDSEGREEEAGWKKGAYGAAVFCLVVSWGFAARLLFLSDSASTHCAFGYAFAGAAAAEALSRMFRHAGGEREDRDTRRTIFYCLLCVGWFLMGVSTNQVFSTQNIADMSHPQAANTSVHPDSTATLTMT